MRFFRTFNLVSLHSASIDYIIYTHIQTDKCRQSTESGLSPTPKREKSCLSCFICRLGLCVCVCACVCVCLSNLFYFISLVLTLPLSKCLLSYSIASETYYKNQTTTSNDCYCMEELDRTSREI